VYLTSANSLFLSFFAFSEINNLHVFNRAPNSDSPRLQSSNCFVINGLQKAYGEKAEDAKTGDDTDGVRL